MSNSTKNLKQHRKQKQKIRKSNPIKSAFHLSTTFPLLFTNTAVHGTIFWITGVPALLLPTDNKLRQKIDVFNIKMGDSWVRFNNFFINKLLPSIDWQIDLPNELSTSNKYLLLCNHQTWVDTMVVQYVALGKFPFTRFFTKFELIFLPFAGQAFKVLGFPMMKRHSKEAIAKNPALRDEDFNEAKKACERMQSNPFTLLNFLEGTRFTNEKRDQQQSPYQNLLKPKYSGVALATMVLADDIDGIIDMTIIYPDGVPTYMDIWKGKLTKIIVKAEIKPVPEWINTENYYSNDEYKTKFKQWINKIWAEKDDLISAHKNH